VHADSTLPEGPTTAIVRAGYASDADSLDLIYASLVDESARVRVLALRAGARREVLDDGDWLRALADTSGEVRRECLVLLGARDVDEAIRRGVERCLDDEDPLVVDAAAFTLGEHPDPTSVEALIRCATHDDARCREAAVAALGAIGDERGLATVLAALEDKAPVRRRAVVALANFEGPEVDAALERARDDRDWQVRAAVDALTRDETL
jgi:HEAT repeat protein